MNIVSSEAFEEAFADYAQVNVYLSEVPNHLSNSNFLIEGRLIEQDAVGALVAFLYGGQELRVYRFMNHTIRAIQVVDVSLLLEDLRIEL